MKSRFKKIACIDLIILGLFLVNVGKAKATVVEWLFDETIAPLLQGIFGVLLMLAQFFTGLVGKLFTGILNFGFRDIAMVYTGWTITRDVVNMFFILALIVIAFATILRIESYGMKALIPKFIIVALLINFSFLACGVIIDASQILAKYFMDRIENDDIGTALLTSLKVTDALRIEEGQSVAISDRNPKTTTLLNTAFSAAIIAVAGFVLLIGAITLFVRIGALWALIILAPFAWFFSIFPKLNTHAGKWWSEFLKWSFFAPIYVFFIYLVLNISKETIKLTAMGDTPAGLQQMSLTAMTSNWNILFHYVFLVVLLFGAPTLAMSMGVKVTSIAKTAWAGGLRGVVKLPLKLRNAAATMVPPAWMEKGVPPAAKLMRGIQKTAAFTSPEFWKKAREARKAERLRKARLPHIIGKMQDIMNFTYSIFSEKTNFAEQAEQFEVEERKKEITAETKLVGSLLLAKLEKAIREKNITDYKATYELLQAQGDTNDSMIFNEMFDNLKYDDTYALDSLKGQNVNDSTKNKDGTTNRRFSNLGFKHGLIQQMRQMNMSDKQIAPFLGKMQEIGLASGYFGMYGMAKADENGNWLITKDKEHMKIAAAKLRTQTGRMRTSKLHSTATARQGADENKQYRFAGRDEVADELLRALTPSDIKETEMRYVRPDTQTIVRQGYEQGAYKDHAVANALGEKFYEEVEAAAKKAAEKGAKKGAGKAAEKGAKKGVEEATK